MFVQNIKHQLFHISNAFEELEEFANNADPFELIIGTDSQIKKRYLTTATVIFLWNLKNRKFRLFYSKEKIKRKKFISVPERMINEVLKSIDIADKIRQTNLVNIIGEKNIEIHLDVGYRGKSRNILSTCTGMVEGNGYKYAVKPDSWLASCVADRFCK